MRYLVDTTVCVAVINGKSPSVRAKVLSEVNGGAELAVSSVTVFELWYGVEKSERKGANARRLLSFLADHVTTLVFDDEDARAAGKIRAELEAAGRRISEYDALIAGQALRRGLTVVTANIREFERVPNLSCENWSQ